MDNNRQLRKSLLFAKKYSRIGKISNTLHSIVFNINFGHLMINDANQRIESFIKENNGTLSIIEYKHNTNK